MTITQASSISNSTRAQYISEYMREAPRYRFYDQLAKPVPYEGLAKFLGTSVIIPVLADLAPSTTTISQVADTPPVAFGDSYISISPTSRTNYVKVSELAEIEAFTDFSAERVRRLAKNQMQSIDLVARDVALVGTFTNSAAARSSLDAGTTSHRASDTLFRESAVLLQAQGAPMYETPRGLRRMALMHPYALSDIVSAASTSYVAVGQYQDASKVLSFEAGELFGFSIVSDPQAKVFYSAGVANGTAVSTTLGSAATALDTTIVVASTASIAAGQRLTIGTLETGSTHYATNEQVVVASTPSSTTVSIIGKAANGGLMYAHDSGATVSNADSVVPIIFGSPSSLFKVYDLKTGEFGTMVGPKRDGSAEQWWNMAYKWYGNYAIPAQGHLLRSEVSVSIDN